MKYGWIVGFFLAQGHLWHHCNNKKKNQSPDGAAAGEMLSKGWTTEPTSCDRFFLQSGHLLWETFQILLLFSDLEFLLSTSGSNGWMQRWFEVRPHARPSSALHRSRCSLYFEPAAVLQVRVLLLNMLHPKQVSFMWMLLSGSKQTYVVGNHSRSSQMYHLSTENRTNISAGLVLIISKRPLNAP